ncbi:MAG: N-acetyltransferase [Proteobacteria bacterium]|nr:N-acetyltransferase [Pseudomonadota bacterium]
MEIRDERPADAAAIRAVVTAAFATAPHSSGTEAAIVDALREAGALTLSLVAEEDGEVVGHIAFSPVMADGSEGGWYGLGPVSVRPDFQTKGIGQALVRVGLERLKESGAFGCVVLGDPAYYARFGFLNDPALRYPGVPPEYFQMLIFAGARPSGDVSYHAAFDAG